MSDHSKIEWTDATWNIITGCSVVSAGCKHCYAMKLAGTRLKNHRTREGLTIPTPAGPVWNGKVRYNQEWLEQPLEWTRSRRIFVCAHGDLFHEKVQEGWLTAIFAVMAMAPQHSFQVLTKRPYRAAQVLGATAFWQEVRETAVGLAAARGRVFLLDPDAISRRFLLNVWIGTSVENQQAAVARVPALLQIPAMVRFLSCEPLLGPINLDQFKAYGEREIPALHWVIVGGESGVGARPMHPRWAEGLRDQCQAAKIPFFFKQWGEYAPGRPGRYGSKFVEVSLDGRVCEPGMGGPRAAEMRRAGKVNAGRVLDGAIHDGMPS